MTDNKDPFVQFEGDPSHPILIGASIVMLVIVCLIIAAGYAQAFVR